MKKLILLALVCALPIACMEADQNKQSKKAEQAQMIPIDQVPEGLGPVHTLIMKCQPGVIPERVNVVCDSKDAYHVISTPVDIEGVKKLIHDDFFGVEAESFSRELNQTRMKRLLPENPSDLQVALLMASAFSGRLRANGPDDYLPDLLPFKYENSKSEGLTKLVAFGLLRSKQEKESTERLSQKQDDPPQDVFTGLNSKGEPFNPKLFAHAQQNFRETFSPLPPRTCHVPGCNGKRGTFMIAISSQGNPQTRQAQPARNSNPPQTKKDETKRENTQEAKQDESFCLMQ